MCEIMVQGSSKGKGTLGLNKSRIVSRNWVPMAFERNRDWVPQFCPVRIYRVFQLDSPQKRQGVYSMEMARGGSLESVNL